MVRINFTVQAFSGGFIPRSAITRSLGQPAKALQARMVKHRLSPQTLSVKAGVRLKTLSLLMSGEISPITTRGLWSKSAIKISRALLSEPEVIFPEALDRIGSALCNPDQEMLPLSLLSETIGSPTQRR